MIGICFLCFSSLDLSLLSSCSGNQFLFTYEPASESWSRFMSPFLLSPHYRIRGYPKIPLVFLSSEFQDRQFIHYKGEKDIFFLIHLILWEWEGRRFQPSFYFLQTINLPNSTSAVKTSDSTQTKAHKVPPGDMKESSKFFSVSPNTHTHTHTHTRSLISSQPSPPFLSLPAPLPFSSLTLLPSIQGDVNGNVH